MWLLVGWYGILAVWEGLRDWMDDETSEAPMVPDYDRQYFAKDVQQGDDQPCNE